MIFFVFVRDQCGFSESNIEGWYTRMEAGKVGRSDCCCVTLGKLLGLSEPWYLVKRDHSKGYGHQVRKYM